MGNDTIIDRIHMDLNKSVLVVHGWLFKDLHFVGKDPLKLNNKIKA